jgi:hypothetical protein
LLKVAATKLNGGLTQPCKICKGRFKTSQKLCISLLFVEDQDLLVSVVRLHLIYNKLEVVGIVISAISCQYLLNDVPSIPAELKRIDLLLFLISE